MEAITISCAGYPTRKHLYEFIDRFGIHALDVLDGRYSIDCLLVIHVLEKTLMALTPFF